MDRVFLSASDCERVTSNQSGDWPGAHKRHRNWRGEKKGTRNMLELIRMRARQGKKRKVLKMRERTLIS